ncbi:MAG: hypothetical protein AB7E55_25290, partial [Pigmentiphaga sp.]
MTLAWYRAGTVSVTNNNASVTGAGGTAWASKAREGDGFVGPDGALYEVASVNSDTSITLRTNYKGTTATGQAYGIMPAAPLSQDLYSRLIALFEMLESEINVGSVNIDGAAAEVPLAVQGDVSFEADASGNQTTILSRNSLSRQALLVLATALAPRARVGF